MDHAHGVGADPRIDVLVGMAEEQTEEVASRLDSVEVVITTTRAHARLAISTANLIARLVPCVRVECADDSPVDLPVFGSGPVAELGASAIENARLVEPKPTRRTIVVSAGNDEPGADFYVAASPWSVALGRKPTQLPLGEGPAITAASALAAAEAIRSVVPELPGRRLGADRFFWNLLDYRCAAAVAEPIPGAVEAVCFGGGSVGSSLVYALLLGDARGQLVIVDPDKLTARNRVRYPLLLGQPDGPKAQWLETAAEGSALELSGKQETAAAFIGHHGAPIRLAVSALDSVAARRDVTDALAYQTLNAGVAALQFHVSRHGFGDGAACLYCGYVDLGQPLEESDVYAQMTGLDAPRVDALLAGETLSRSDVAELVKRAVLSHEERDEFEGARLQDVVRRRVYAQAEVRSSYGVVAIGAPFVSALAGAILAAEVQKSGLEQWWLNRRVDVDCSGFPTGLQTKPPQDTTGRCLCHARFRKSAYSELWLS